ncbi:MAG: Protein containing Fibronectin, type III-like protein [Candidatus Peregrinibacteria bacterium GW2011_GWF2_43_17]|nr:MAG: Protein containing Fibronectin, type III-like protein [Candidatus Peregrinibacteria bacterium GW2011_GWF2_43_17]KKT19569.1 MAG: Protein containing Fibronectin, type III-like protein [Candidatus Peregrinibacteria bacterium GW2011_GWA2_43_8]HAU39986.1 hypothetical protein [Candidatus Peregrinibacteria bacterium]
MKNKIALLTTLVLLMIAPIVRAADADVQVPGDVENLEAFAGEESVNLSWDMAADNVLVTGYKIYYGIESVSEDAGEYTFDPIETDDDISYEVTGLTAGVTYYFAVTALDAAGNESDYYSNEAAATPVDIEEEEVADTEAPYIVEAVATDKMTVEVNFSEEVDLPTDAASAFSIVGLENDEELDVLDAYTSDENESVVVVTTGTQEAGVSYMITVNTSVTDKTGNSVVSGTIDSAVFDGTDAEPVIEDEELPEEEDVSAKEETDIESPEITDVEAETLTEIIIGFNENVMLPAENLETAFEVYLADDETVTLTVLSAIQDEVDLSKVVLATSEQSPGEDYVLKLTGITDLSGNELVNDFDRTASFTAAVIEIADLIPPEDITNFLAELIDGLPTSVGLSWTASINTAGDLVDQLLYMSEDGGDNYGDAESLGPDTTSYTVDGLTEGETYTFMLTTVDEAGNESIGVVKSVTLPQTGAGLGIVLIATALGTKLVTRK